ncbi:unnamed protein product [Larinioides sclopetarius]|uniref:Uncharacterized protein n=1 Tax=Larinioides sclopetarius TaxID=280406 RepID=A0AAV1ZHW3_9ARAC
MACSIRRPGLLITGTWISRISLDQRCFCYPEKETPRLIEIFRTNSEQTPVNDMDLHSVYRYDNTDLLTSFQKQKESNDEFTNISEAVKDSKNLGKDIKVPRFAQRSRLQLSTPEDYFKVSIYNP